MINLRCLTISIKSPNMECSQVVKQAEPLRYAVIGHKVFENGKLFGDVLEVTDNTYLIQRVSHNRYINGTEQTITFLN